MEEWRQGTGTTLRSGRREPSKTAHGKATLRRGLQIKRNIGRNWLIELWCLGEALSTSTEENAEGGLLHRRARSAQTSRIRKAHRLMHVAGLYELANDSRKIEGEPQMSRNEVSAQETRRRAPNVTCYPCSKSSEPTPHLREHSPTESDHSY